MDVVAAAFLVVWIFQKQIHTWLHNDGHKGRPVKVFEWWRPNGVPIHTPMRKRELGSGVLLRFGVNITESETSMASYTTAIVEMEDGDMLNVDVELIQFTDR